MIDERTHPPTEDEIPSFTAEDLAEREREVLADLAATARRGAVRLPSTSGWRSLLVRLAAVEPEPAGAGVDQGHAQSLAARGFEHAEERVRLSNALQDAREAVDDSTARLSRLLDGALEGTADDDTTCGIGPAEVDVDTCVERFDAATRAAVGFLLSKGGLNVSDISPGEAVSA